MNIDISQSDQQRLQQHAQAAGYDDVTQFIVHHLQALARQATPSELESPSKKTLLNSVGMCDRSMQEFDEGKGVPFDDGMKSMT